MWALGWAGIAIFLFRLDDGAYTHCLKQHREETGQKAEGFPGHPCSPVALALLQSRMPFSFHTAAEPCFMFSSEPTVVVLGWGAPQIPSCSHSISECGLGEEAAPVLVHHLIGGLSTTILL